MPDPNQNQQNNQAGASSQQVPSVFPQSDLPPLPPDFQNVSGTPLNATGPSDKSGSTPPSDIPPIISQPKKKFSGGRIIATILGILLLVGGVGAGLVLTQQQQLFQQKAAVIDYCESNADCPSGQKCIDTINGKRCQTVATPASTPTVKNECFNDDDCGPNEYCKKLTTGNKCAPKSTPVATPRCGNCRLGDKISCIIKINNQPGTKTCVNSEDCAGRVNAGSWGECIANTTTSNNNSGCQLPSVMINGVCTAPSGNCASYRPGAGKCFVTTHIGADPSGNAVCDGPHWTTCAQGYTCSNFDCVPQTTTNNGGGGPANAQCSTVKAYDTNYTLLTSSQLSSLTAGTSVNFCIGGTSSAGGFDKAKFTINGAVQAETTATRPGSADFCQSYQIPSSVTSFNVTAQIHHSTLGWSN